jgi:hypothetical protein
LRNTAVGKQLLTCLDRFRHIFNGFDTVKLVLAGFKGFWQVFLNYKKKFQISVIVDANSLCNLANFNIGSSTATTRSWSIKVT